MNTVPRINPESAQRARAIDPAEWETRIDLAACYRLVDLYGMTDLHLNHISARVPGNSGSPPDCARRTHLTGSTA
jgi:hypothetical protein